MYFYLIFFAGIIKVAKSNTKSTKNSLFTNRASGRSQQVSAIDFYLSIFSFSVFLFIFFLFIYFTIKISTFYLNTKGALHQYKKAQGGGIIHGGHNKGVLFVLLFIGSNAFRAYWFSFHGIEGFSLHCQFAILIYIPFITNPFFFSTYFNC